MTAWQQLQFHHRAAFSNISEALELDSSGRGSDALPAYKKGIAELQKGLSVKVTDAQKNRRETMLRLKAKMRRNLEMAEERVKVISCSPASLRAKSCDRINNVTRGSPLAYRGVTSSRPACVVNASRCPKAAISKLRNTDPKLKQVILEHVIKSDSSLTLDDIVGNEVAKKSLFETVVLPAKNPDLFTGLRAPVQGLLLFGPPGNGKTMLAQAAAFQSGYLFFSISAASLMSKWVGEAEKLVQALFAVARATQPSIIFIDEIDSILRERSDNEHEVSRRLKTEFLLQFDGVHSKSSDRVLIIGATNRPFDLDEAVLRRLPKRLYIPLPNKQDRVKMLRMLLREQKHVVTDRAFSQIGSSTEGFSFADLKSLAKEAAMEPLRELSIDHLDKIKVEQLRPLRAVDFVNALQQCRPSVKGDHIKRLEDFASSHGHAF
uniref:microtubule-severing ATPase n=1 Tax=Trichuris muris TaxID=70415 RepID=A0A5S6QJE3_TRIMR